MPDTVLAKDLMQTHVMAVRVSDSAAELCDMFQREHVHGAPVVDDDDNLVGIVSQEDILIGSMSWPPEQSEGEQEQHPLVGDIMTAPAIAAAEDTSFTELCRMMWRFRIHHVPIVREGKVVGMVSSLDICRAFAEGLKTAP